MSKKDIGKITSNEMKESILRSGYLLEQKVETILQNNGYYVEANAAYPDSLTGQSREIDIAAISAFKMSKDYDFIFSNLICECENNSQPVVFFNKYSQIDFLHYQDLKCAGMPISFLSTSNSEKFISFPDFVKAGRFHHYCKGPISTQYCSFNRRNNQEPWMALHETPHHESLTGLINAVEAKIKNYYQNYSLPNKDEIEKINIEIYYPVLILQGPLYAASLRGKKLKLSKVKHVNFRKEIYTKDIHETYQIDVITESYLKDYLDIIEDEIESIKKVFKSKKKIIRKSINLLVEKARKKDEKTSFREIFETS